jgi:hypothetical protein
MMPIFGRLFDIGRYDGAFLLAGSLPLAGFAVWLALNRVAAAR